MSSAVRLIAGAVRRWFVGPSDEHNESSENRTMNNDNRENRENSSVNSENTDWSEKDLNKPTRTYFECPRLTGDSGGSRDADGEIDSNLASSGTRGGAAYHRLPPPYVPDSLKDSQSFSNSNTSDIRGSRHVTYSGDVRHVTYPGDVILVKHSCDTNISFNLPPPPLDPSPGDIPPEYHSVGSMERHYPSLRVAERVCCCERCSPQCDTAYVQHLSPVLPSCPTHRRDMPHALPPSYTDVLLLGDLACPRRSASFGSVLQRRSACLRKREDDAKTWLDTSLASLSSSVVTLSSIVTSYNCCTRGTDKSQPMLLKSLTTTSSCDCPSFPLTTSPSISTSITSPHTSPPSFANLPPSIRISRDGEEGFAESQRSLRGREARKRMSYSCELNVGGSSCSSCSSSSVVPPNRTICHIDG